MRLTLRTLLAYLDGILEPNDAQDLGKKIEESEYATGLVHRIRDVMRRLRLGAPNLAERNPKSDSNTVAEYLDNTLTADAVTDFEKVCLDSDVHLAEVASCHQILTLVLGEPAEIDPASRQRMYQLSNEEAAAAVPAAQPAAQTPAGHPPALNLGPTDDSADRKARPKPTVPEYLREPRRQSPWVVVAVLVILACFALVVLQATGQFEPTAPIGKLLVRMKILTAPATELAAGPTTTVEPVEKPAAPHDSGAAAPIPPSTQESATKGPTESAPVASKENKENAPIVNSPADKIPPVEPSKEAPSDSASKAAAPFPPADAIVTDKPPKIESPDVSKKADAGPALPPPESAKDDAKAKASPKNATELTPDTGAAKKPELPAETETKPALAPLPPEPMGRLMSTDQVLLRDDPSGEWVWMSGNPMLMPQRLVAMPTYRPKVTLTVGVALDILGGTRLDLLPSSLQDPPGVRLHFGRIVMMPLGQAGSRIRVAFGDRSGILTFANADSVAAVEVRRLHKPGTNPETVPPHIIAKLYASTSNVRWEESVGGEPAKAIQLQAPQWVSFNAALTSEPAASKELPLWIMAEPISALDRRASATIAQALPPDRSARVGLLELSSARPQKEVRWLALRCLCYLDQFRDMVTALNDPTRKLEWPEYIEQLREAVARDAESAAAVRMAIEKEYPQQSASVYRMLWGYTDKDLQAGADADLVKALEDDLLAMRVLGSWNLTDVTGLGGWSFRPEQPAAKRMQATQRWKQRLKSGDIRLKTPEEKASAAAQEKSVITLPPPSEMK